MISYIFRRILATLPITAVVAVSVFLLVRLGSSDPAIIIAGDFATAKYVEEVRHGLGLDLPLYEQFWIWASHLVQGDLGVSIFTKRPVAEMIRHQLEPTLLLAITTMGLAILVAVPLGIAAAVRVGTWVDHGLMILSVTAFSFPVFLIGYALIYGLALGWRWFPVQGYTSIREGFSPFLSHIVLPAITLGSVYAALIARVSRASMIEVLHEDYIRTAQAKGLSTGRLLLGHALRNASVPIVTVIGLGVGSLITGVVITESVFAIPGLGRMTADAVIHRDYPIVQALVLLFSLSYVVINLIVDILYTILDPRIRY